MHRAHDLKRRSRSRRARNAAPPTLSVHLAWVRFLRKLPERFAARWPRRDGGVLHFALAAARTLVCLSILPRCALFKRPQPICAAKNGLFFVDATGIAIPFRRLTPEIDDLLLERRREAARCSQTSRDCFDLTFIRQGERDSDAPAVLLSDHEWELRMAACAERPLDDIDATLARRKGGEPAVVEPHDAAEATAMHDVTADVLHC
jgi:hypothetical protein